MAEVNQGVYFELKNLFENLTKCSKDLNENSDLQQQGDVGPNWEEHVSSIVSKIDGILPTLPMDSEEFIKLLSMKASTLYEKAKIYLNNEVIDKCQEMLINALNIIEHYSTHPKIAFLYLRIVNHLSYSLSRRGECEKARELLEKVIDNDFEEQPLIYSSEELFYNIESDQTQAEYKLNKLIINNMQMLGWVYGKLGLYESHTTIQHRALQKQIESEDIEPIQMAIKCSRLASLFLNQSKFVQSRYLLCSAQTILDTIEPEDAQTNAELVKTQADLSKCFMYYSLHLYGLSRKYIIDNAISTATDFSPFVDSSPPDEEVLPESFEFSNLQVNLLKLPASIITTTDQAKLLFHNVFKWLKRVQLYYNLKDFPLEYVNAMMDLSELYKYLAFYEPDLDSQYSVQKKRYDALEGLNTILREIRPNCYVSVSVELLRELTEVQLELMGINLKRIYHAEHATIGENALRRRMAAVNVLNKRLGTLGGIINRPEVVTVYQNADEADKQEEEEDEADEVEEEEEEVSAEVDDEDDNENIEEETENIVASEKNLEGSMVNVVDSDVTIKTDVDNADINTDNVTEKVKKDDVKNVDTVENIEQVETIVE